MNGIMSSVSGCYQEVGIENRISVVRKIMDPDRIHVMDKQIAVDLVLFDPKITPHVTNYHHRTKGFPLSGGI